VADPEDPNGIVIRLPARTNNEDANDEAADGGDLSYVPPPIPDYLDTLPPSREDFPESPEETTLELPAFPDPVESAASASGGIPDGEIEEGGEGFDGEETESGEGGPRPSLADVFARWIDHRIDLGRTRADTEAPYREAEIKRKIGLLEARTARETSLMAAHGKLRDAQLKSRADRAAAGGKTNTDRPGRHQPGSGLGSDKGRTRTKTTGGGSGTPGGAGGGRGPKPHHGNGNGNGGTHRPDRRSPDPKTGPGNRGGGDSPARRQPKQHTPGSGGDERPRGGGRSERAAKRQKARLERRNREHAADLADRTTDRDRNRHRKWDKQDARDTERREDRAERRRERKEKKERKQEAEQGRTTLGQAVVEEAERRFDKRRRDATDGKAKTDGDARGSAGDKTDPPKEGKNPQDGPEATGAETGTGAGKDHTDTNAGRGPDAPETGREGPSGGRTGAPGSDTPGGPGKSGSGPFSGSPGGSSEDAGWRSGWQARWERFRRGDQSQDNEPPVPADSVGITVERGDQAPAGAPEISPGPQGLPRAPEPHTQRPGTTRPDPRPEPGTDSEQGTSSGPDLVKHAGPGSASHQENAVGNSVSTREPQAASSRRRGQAGMAAKHRTNITYDEYLIRMARIATAADADADSFTQLAQKITAAVNDLKAWAGDLADGHNIDPKVVTELEAMADDCHAASAAATQAGTGCKAAAEASKIAARAVARVYGEDMAEVDAAGLASASAAAHHD